MLSVYEKLRIKLYEHLNTLTGQQIKNDIQTKCSNY